MSDADTPSITDLAHERGEDGDVLPVTETVEVHGQEVAVEIYPATTGQRAEWRNRLEGEGEDLSDEVTYDLLDEFAAHDPGDFGGADSWEDIRPAITDAVANLIFARLFDAEDVDEFMEALNEAVEEHTAEAVEGNPD